MNIKNLRRKERLLYQNFGIISPKRCFCEVEVISEDNFPFNFDAVAEWDLMGASDEEGFAAYMAAYGYTVYKYIRVENRVRAAMYEGTTIELAEVSSIIAIPDTTIRLSLNNIIDMTELPFFISVTELVVTGGTLENIDAYAGVTFLDIAGLPAVTNLPTLPNAINIRIASCPITDLPLAPSVQNFIVEDLPITEVDEYSTMTYLNVLECNDLVSIADQPNLEITSIDGVDSLIGIPVNLPSIATLDIRRADIITEIGDYSGATSIRLETCPSLITIAPNAISGLNVLDCAQVVTIPLTSVMTAITVQDCPLFTSFTGDYDSIVSLYIDSNTLSQVELDIIATAYIANSAIKSVWNSTNQTPVAQPSGPVLSDLVANVNFVFA